MCSLISGTYLEPISQALSQVTKEKIRCKVTIDPTLPDVESDMGIINVSIFPEKRADLDLDNKKHRWPRLSRQHEKS